MAGFVSLAKAIEPNNDPVDKVRGKPEKFGEHYLQARLFFDSQTPQEQAHIVGAFRFELSKVTVPAIRRRMVSSLMNVSKELANAIAEGLGLELPEAMPRAIKRIPTSEVRISPPLSLMALPGKGDIATRKVAVLVADGVEGASLTSLVKSLNSAGAVTRLLGSRLGTVQSEGGGERFEVDATLENSPAVLFDAMVLPAGPAAISALMRDGRSLEFLKDQYRHCKTILALGTSTKLLEEAGIASNLPGGDPDPGLIVGSDAGKDFSKQFIAAIGRHRYPERDRDPPLV
jgi:catalase